MHTLLSTLHLIHADAFPSLAKLSVLRTAKGKKIQIIKRLAPKWRKFGILLDFDESGTQVDIIQAKHSGDPENCCEATFQFWLKGNGLRPCSWRKLIEVLEDCGEQTLAQDINSALTT